MSSSSVQSSKSHKSEDKTKQTKTPKPDESAIQNTDNPTTLKTKATKIYQDAKEQMEQSGNIRTTIKEHVIEALGELYLTVLEVNDANRLLQLQTMKAQGLCLEERHKQDRLYMEQMESLLKSTYEEIKLRVDIKELAKEITNNIHNLQTGEEPITQLLTGTKEKIGEMYEKVDEINTTLKQRDTRDTNTYAKATIQKSSIKKDTMHSIIISSDKDSDSSEEIITKIRKAADAKKTGIQVDRIRKVKDQKVVIGCSDRKGVAALTDRLKEVAPNLRVETMENKDPQLIIRDVLTANTDEEILTSIKN